MNPTAESRRKTLRRKKLRVRVVRRPIRVLLVDDHAMFRQMMTAYLHGQRGIEVVGAARDGAEALRLVAQRNPEVVLLDVHLPDMSGIAVTRGVCSSFPSVAILALTGHDDPGCRAALMNAGARGYLPKTASIEEVAMAVQTVAAGRSLLITDTAAPASDGLAEALTARELEVLRLLAIGLRNLEVADALVLSVKTVEFHISHILAKLEARSRTEALLKARELDLLRPTGPMRAWWTRAAAQGAASLVFLPLEKLGFSLATSWGLLGF